MGGLTLTRHAMLRMAQRGIRADDIELITTIGIEVEGGFFVRRKDVQSFERQLRRLSEQARRLQGKRIVLANDAVVSAYHARQGKERRLLRRSAHRSAA